MKVIVVIVVCAVLVGWASWNGCAGAGGGGGGGEAGAGPPGGGGGGAKGGGAADVAGCPAVVPVSGKACEPSGRLCTYGTAPRGECRERATCVGGTWATRAAECAPSPAGDCPATVPAATACARPDQLCAYAGGIECVCVAGSIGWLCDTPRSPGPDCPVTPPNAGTACAGSTSCTYACGLLSTDAVFARCAADGTWTWALMPCTNVNRAGGARR